MSRDTKGAILLVARSGAISQGTFGLGIEFPGQPAPKTAYFNAQNKNRGFVTN